jgi:hypothetical protein
MKVDVRGQKQLMADLERRLGPTVMKHKVDAAITAGAKVFVKELKQQFKTFRDTGASIEEITISEPFWMDGVRTVRVHWKGPKNRYRIIHLNEWGTVKNPNPRGKGAIARALKSSEKAYRDAIRRSLGRSI